jgi:hypothetical protein
VSVYGCCSGCKLFLKKELGNLGSVSDEMESLWVKKILVWMSKVSEPRDQAQWPSDRPRAGCTTRAASTDTAVCV